MKHQTQDLTGIALDWAVFTLLDDDLSPEDFVLAHHGNWGTYTTQHNYSTNWGHGGPILEREGIDVFRRAKGDGWEWMAGSTKIAQSGVHKRKIYVRRTGPTPLIAAMRCYLACKLGDEIDIPEELK